VWFFQREGEKVQTKHNGWGKKKKFTRNKMGWGKAEKVTAKKKLGRRPPGRSKIKDRLGKNKKDEKKAPNKGKYP